jgi:glucokinase
MENTVVLGIDIGGSHITAAFVNLETKAIVAGSQQRRFVDSNGTAEEILDSWCEVIKTAVETTPVSKLRLGIAFPGPFDYEKGISLIQDQPKFRSLYQWNLKEEIGQRLQLDAADILFSNDAASFLQGEVFCGAASEFSNVLGLTLGTGLGAALVVEKGRSEDAILWSRPFLEGSAEDYLSTRWFVERYLQLTGSRIEGAKALTEMGGNNNTVQQIFREFAANMALFLSPVIRQTPVDAIVIGGNIAKASEFFLPQLALELKEQHIEAAIKIAELNEMAALIGAASVFGIVADANI